MMASEKNKLEKELASLKSTLDEKNKKKEEEARKNIYNEEQRRKAEQMSEQVRLEKIAKQFLM
jgi:hypothetical protein